MDKVLLPARIVGAKLLILAVVLAVLVLAGCAAIFGEADKPDGAIESQAAAEIVFAETIKTATIYRAEQIEAGENKALVGVDAGLIALVASDRLSSTLAPIHGAGRTMSLDELDRLIDERDQLLQAYYGAGSGTSISARVTEFFEDVADLLDGARIALGVGDLAGAESSRLKAIEALRTLRNILDEGG